LYRATRGSVITDTDCNDADATVNPGMKEVCSNGKDDNCDGLQDTENADGCLTYYIDMDQDGYGDSAYHKCLCAPVDCVVPPTTWSCYNRRDGGDCQDGNPNIHPGVNEICDGIDNNCSSSIDEIPPYQTEICPVVGHATSVCLGAQCVIQGCEGGWFNVNGLASDGCECAQDADDYTANTCADAKYLGEALDNGIALPLVTGRIVPDSDSDWYFVNAKDSADGGTFAAPGSDSFNLKVKLLSPTNGSIKIEVRKGGCNANPTCTGGTTYEWAQTGEAPCVSVPNGTPGQLWSCCAPGQCDAGAGANQNACCNNVAACTSDHNLRHCIDDAASFYFRVYHDPTTAATTRCVDTEYTVEVSNGKPLE